MSEENNNKDILIGTLIGGVIGTAAALLLAPKAGSELREDIADKYCEVSDLLNEQIEDGVCQIKKTMGIASRPTFGTGNFILGGLAAGLLGATAAMLLTPKSGRTLRRQLSNSLNSMARQYTHARRK